MKFLRENKILDMIESIDNLRKHLNNQFPEELEYLSLQHLFYGSALKLLPLKNFRFEDEIWKKDV